MGAHDSAMQERMRGMGPRFLFWQFNFTEYLKSALYLFYFY